MYYLLLQFFNYIFQNLINNFFHNNLHIHNFIIIIHFNSFMNNLLYYFAYHNNIYLFQKPNYNFKLLIILYNTDNIQTIFQKKLYLFHHFHFQNLQIHKQINISINYHHNHCYYQHNEYSINLLKSYIILMNINIIINHIQPLHVLLINITKHNLNLVYCIIRIYFKNHNKFIIMVISQNKFQSI